MKSEKENLVLRKVLKFLEQRKKEKFTDVYSPDDEERNKEAPDLAFRGSKSDYVLEHTRIESFVDQIGEGHRFVNLLNPIVEAVKGKLPELGHYQLVIEAGSVGYPKNVKEIQQSLSEWILQEAPNLKVWKEPTQTDHFKTTQLTNMPFKVSLFCLPGLDGELLIARAIPENLEEERAKRIKRALDAKCPKLELAKSHNGTSILVLESNDMALGNTIKIAEALTKELANRASDIPDEVYLVETETSNWYLWILKEGQSFSPLTNVLTSSIKTLLIKVKKKEEK